MAYVEAAIRESDLDRLGLAETKTGGPTGAVIACFAFVRNNFPG